MLVEWLLGFLPPTSRDELTHHLAIPKLYADAGRIVEVPVAPYAYYPMLVDMLYTPWIYWGYDFVPKWIHALYGALTGLLIYAYLGWRMSGLYGLLGALLFLSTPVILRLSHWGYIDLGLTFYTTAALLLMLRWRENRNALSALALAGLSLGFALATKPNGLVAALIIVMLFAWVLAKPPRKTLFASMQETALFGALTLLPFLPWLLKNWWQTGNPFYPFFPGWFRAKATAVLDAASFPGIGIFDKRELLYGENIWQIGALPLRLFFSGQDDNPQYFDGVLTPLLIVLLPWVFTGKWSEDKKIARRVCPVVTFLCGLFGRPAGALCVVDSPAAGDLSGLRSVQYLCPDQTAGDSIRRPINVRAMAWRISLEVCRGGRSVALSNWRGEPRWLSLTHAAGVSDVSLYQPGNAAECENLSSLYRPESVLLPAKLFPRWRRTSRISAGRDS